MWAILPPLLIVIFIAGIAYLFWPKNTGNEGPFDLQKQKSVGKGIDTFKFLRVNENGGGTIQFFVYPVGHQRTGTLEFCRTGGAAGTTGTTAGLSTNGESECNTERYRDCVCPLGDCSECEHKSYVNVINVSNVLRLEMLAVPDASRRDAVAAQLVVRTRAGPSATSVTSTATIMEETLALPTLPMQKWTMVTIAREGRRYDVYFNNSMVLSKRTQHVLDQTAATGDIIAGDPDLSGKVGFVNVYDRKLSATEVSYAWADKADTNGKPHFASDLDISHLLPGCKGGSCIRGPSVRPASPLLDWDTEYE